MFSALRFGAGFAARLVARCRGHVFRRWLVLVLLEFLAIGAAHADQAWLIIDAIKQPATGRQPTWIALWGRGGLIHIPTGRTVVEVAAGHYRILHLDFHKSEHSGFGTVFLADLRWTHFKASSDVITHVGMLQVGPGDEYSPLLRLSLVPRLAQLEWACHSHPELLARLPVRISTIKNKARLLRVRCEAGPEGIRESAGDRSAEGGAAGTDVPP